MKSLIVVYLAFMIVRTDVQAQTSQIADNGIYLTSEDYVHMKLTHSFNRKEGSHFRLDKSLIVRIKSKNGITDYYYDDIWGLRQDGMDYRLYANELIRIKFYSVIPIYYTPDPFPIEGSECLFFSEDLTTPLYELNRKNLAIVFRSNSKFIEMLNSLSPRFSLYEWDTQNNRFEFINWLFKDYR